MNNQQAITETRAETPKKVKVAQRLSDSSYICVLCDFKAPNLKEILKHRETYHR